MTGVPNDAKGSNHPKPVHSLCTRGVRLAHASHSKNPSICWAFHVEPPRRHPPRSARANGAARNGRETPSTTLNRALVRARSGIAPQLQPLVPPQVLHFMQVPFRTSV